jgi:hypothetical protein
MVVGVMGLNGWARGAGARAAVGGMCASCMHRRMHPRWGVVCRWCRWGIQDMVWGSYPA